VPGDTPTAPATTVTGVGGKISMWFYKNGSNAGTTHTCIGVDGNGQAYETTGTTTVSAIKVLQDAGLRDSSTGAGIDHGNWWTDNDTMTNTVFAIMRVDYDQNHGITGVGQIKALVNNDLKAPGAVMKDYLKNERYGCGVKSFFINDNSFADLDTYSLTPTVVFNSDGTEISDPFDKYELDGYVDTTRDCLSNLVDMATSCDSWVQWNETLGQWSVKINRRYDEEPGITSEDQLRIVTANNIIGGINISPLDLNSTYNKLKVQFPNSDYTYKGATDFRHYEMKQEALNPNEPSNQLTLTLPLVNDSRRAIYIGYKQLFASREDMIINFTMDYSGITIDAGDVIRLGHEWYFWGPTQDYPANPYKLFRVTQVKEMKDPNGFLSVQITATSYNQDVYYQAESDHIHEFKQSSFASMGDPNYIEKPPAPTFTQINATMSTFVVQGLVPIKGNVEGMEFLYSVKGGDIVNNNYILYSTQYYNNGPLYPNYSSSGNQYQEQIQTSYLPPGDYYWRTRALGPNNTTSAYSDAAHFGTWAPTGSPITGTQILDNTISGSKVISGDPPGSPNPPSQNPGFFQSLAPYATLGLAAMTGYSLYKKYGNDLFGKGDDPNAEQVDGEPETIEPTVVPKVVERANGDPVPPEEQENATPQEGDKVETVVDNTPPQPSVDTTQEEVVQEDPSLNQDEVVSSDDYYDY
jgi:hypothetical protein